MRLLKLGSTPAPGVAGRALAASRLSARPHAPVTDASVRTSFSARARKTAPGAGALPSLFCQPHDVPILVAARLLKPLGNPPPNSVKFFVSSDILDLTKDRTWLAKVTQTLIQHWQKKNAVKKMDLPFWNRCWQAVKYVY